MNETAEILLATYNGEAFLAQQIDSILAQSSGEWRLTISDDGSTDGTQKIIRDYTNRYPEKIRQIRSGKRFGNARDHFFYLMGRCEADYLFTCDQDDRWYPNKIERMMQAMAEAEREHGSETPILVFSDQTPTDARLNPLAPSLMRYQNQFFGYFDYRSLLMQNVVTGGAMMMNRALRDLVMACADPAQTIMHDWWAAIVAARFGKIVYIDEPLGDYRQHGSNSVGAKDVHSLAHIAHKMAHLDGIRRTLAQKKAQADMFARTYAQMLGDDDGAFLEPFIRPRSGPLFYWKNRKWIHGFFRLAGMMTLG